MNELNFKKEFKLVINDIIIVSFLPKRKYYYLINKVGSISVYNKIPFNKDPVYLANVNKKEFYTKLEHILRDNIIDNILE